MHGASRAAQVALEYYESERAAYQKNVFHRKRWEIPCYK